VDIDFQHDRRHEVKAYVTKKYGNVSNIITINRWGGKSAIKDAARVLGVPYKDVTRAMKNNDYDGDDYFAHFRASERGREFLKKYPEVMKMAEAFDGRIRGHGMHAAGTLISKDDMFKYAPLETAKDPNDPNGPRVPMAAYDMVEVAKIGLQKIDFLGLKAMSIIDQALKSIEERHNKRIDPLEIPLEDKNVYDMISKGYTKGVFQCEARPYTGLIIKMGGVWSFAELVASNALVRPGAMNTIGAEYIGRKNGKRDVDYVHMDAKWFTEDTYGEVLYQEQVMLMMTEIAGMSMEDANKVRSIIGKKKNPAEFEKFKAAWLEGASKKIKTQKAEKLWTDFEAHAGYSFNKSHAVAYSMVSYWTAWLKYYYPSEFMAAVLRNEEDKDYITDYLIETKRLGIKVLLPHVNRSDAKVSLDGDDVRLGLESVKFISDKISPKLIEYRPYTSYADLEARVTAKGSGLNRRVLSALNAIGGATFPDNPRHGKERSNYYEYVGIPAFEVKGFEPVVEYKFRTLDEYEETGVFPVIGMVRKITRKDGWCRLDILDETGSVGVFADENIPVESGQRYAFLIADNRVCRFSTTDDVLYEAKSIFIDYLYGRVPELEEGQFYSLAFRTHITKEKKEKMGYVVCMDHLGDLRQIMIWPSLYNTASVIARAGAVFKGQVKELERGGYAFKEIKQ
jgi:DNA polymerase-3 subunit alpha